MSMAGMFPHLQNHTVEYRRAEYIIANVQSLTRAERAQSREPGDKGRKALLLDPRWLPVIRAHFGFAVWCEHVRLDGEK